MALSTNLVSYWKFDESSGNAADSVGTNTLSNTSVTYSAAKINNGSVYTNAVSYFTMSSVPVTGTGAFSISLWYKGTTPTGGQRAIELQWGKNSADQAVEVFVDTNGKTNFTTFSSQQFIGTANVSDNNWHHIVFVYDPTLGSNNFKTYVDTVIDVQGTHNTTNLGSTNGGFINKQTYSSTIGFSMTLDEVGIWSRALSSTEVTQLYNSGSGITYPFTQNLTLALSTGYYTLTGEPLTVGKAFQLALQTGYYVLSGIAQTLKYLPYPWSAESKNTGTWNAESKNTGTWVAQSKS